jgi:hypothetical protein
MILSLEDIPWSGGILSFLVWLAQSAVFYFVCFVAAMNAIDDFTRNSAIKVPMMWGISILSAGLMFVLNYRPMALILLMMVANWFRVAQLEKKMANENPPAVMNKALYFVASYGYIALTYYLNLKIRSLVVNI